MKKLLLNLIIVFLFSQLTMAQNAEFKMVSDKSTVTNGEEFTVNIQASGITQFLGFQWPIIWNTSEYVFVSAHIKNLDGSGNQNENFNEITPGKLLSLWVFSTKPIDLANNTEIVEMKFKAIKNGNTDGICFASIDPFAIELWKDKLNQIVPIQADFIGLGCGFVWAKKANGTKTITPFNATTNSKDLAKMETLTFPNPVENEFFIKGNFDSNDNFTFSVFDALGKLVFSKNNFNANGGEILNFDISTLSTGQYIYQLKTNDKISTGKLTKM